MYPLYNEFVDVVRSQSENNEEYAIYFEEKDWESLESLEIEYTKMYGTIDDRTFKNIISNPSGCFFFGTSYESAQKMFNVLEKSGSYKVIMFNSGVCIGELK